MIVAEGMKKKIFAVNDARLTSQLLISSGIGILLNAVTDDDFFPLDRHIEDLTNLTLRYLLVVD